MKKTIKISALALLCISKGYAGSMGPASQPSTTNPYVGLEGSYTWNQTNPVKLNSYTAQLTNQRWGGRLAAGLVRPYTDKFSFTGEFGGGYYGSTKINMPLNGVNINRQLEGYDLSVGGIYKINRLGLFGNVGAMAQNIRIKTVANKAKQIPGGVFSGIETTHTSQTEILPEIKVGGIYNLTDSLDLSLSYMHVFGSTVSGTTSIVESPGVIVSNSNTTTRNPTLDSILFGLRYNFV